MSHRSPFTCLRLGPIIGVMVAGIVACTKTSYPFSHREAFMRTVDSELANYAAHNDGCFPDGHNPCEALARLYPDYCDTGSELAGLSGSIQQVTNALSDGRSISNLTSWVYVPGLCEGDNPQIAILWESMPGLTQAGRVNSHKSRPVLLLDRSITNVLDTDWASFLKQQEQLRNAVQTKRAAGTNALPQGTR
jgi:hypothetical protein